MPAVCNAATGMARDASDLDASSVAMDRDEEPASIVTPQRTSCFHPSSFQDLSYLGRSSSGSGTVSPEEQECGMLQRQLSGSSTLSSSSELVSHPVDVDSDVSMTGQLSGKIMKLHKQAEAEQEQASSDPADPAATDAAPGSAIKAACHADACGALAGTDTNMSAGQADAAESASAADQACDNDSNAKDSPDNSSSAPSKAVPGIDASKHTHRDQELEQLASACKVLSYPTDTTDSAAHTTELPAVPAGDRSSQLLVLEHEAELMAVEVPTLAAMQLEFSQLCEELQHLEQARGSTSLLAEVVADVMHVRQEQEALVSQQAAEMAQVQRTNEQLRQQLAAMAQLEAEQEQLQQEAAELQALQQSNEELRARLEEMAEMQQQETHALQGKEQRLLRVQQQNKELREQLEHLSGLRQEQEELMERAAQLQAMQANNAGLHAELAALAGAEQDQAELQEELRQRLEAARAAELAVSQLRWQLRLAGNTEELRGQLQVG
jgi:hypothetical protein